ncbi:MAG: hypothetical protein ACETWE_08040 [Candidatus Bathyarchaeia archaeon]
MSTRRVGPAVFLLLTLMFLKVSHVQCSSEYTYYGYVPSRIWRAEPVLGWLSGVPVGEDWAIDPLTVTDFALLTAVAYKDDTEVEVYTLPDKELVKAATLPKMGKLFVKLHNGTFFKVRADKPLSIALVSGKIGGQDLDPSLDFSHVANSFYTSVDGGFVGKEFIFIASQGLSGLQYRVVALEECEVEVEDEDGNTVQTFRPSANEFEELILGAFKAYGLKSTGNIMVHTTSLGFIPSVDGGYIGKHFFSTCQEEWWPSRARSPNSFQISASQETKVTIYDVELRKFLEQLTVPSGENVIMKSVAKEIFIEADKPVTLVYVNNDGTYGYGAGLSFMGLGADQKALVYVPTDPTRQESYIFTCEETVVTIDSAPIKLSADSIFPLSAGLHEIATDKNILIQSTYWAAHTPIQGIQSFAAVIPAVEMVNIREEVQLKPMTGEEPDPPNYLLYFALAVAAAATVGVSYYLRAKRRP